MPDTATAMDVFDYDRFERYARDSRAAFMGAHPFPHTVIDDFLPAEVADRVLDEFTETMGGWTHYNHFNENKLAITELGRMGPVTQQVMAALQSERFIAAVGELSGIEGLIPDPHLDGAGLHRIDRGGFLNVHTDFLSHTVNRHWSRQINLLLYLNKDWREEWDGNLELWDPEMTRCERSILPAFNRCVIFHTRERSFHGHPHKLACPEGDYRKSIALYYFRDEGTTRKLSPTNYRARPEDGPVKRALIAADRLALRGYSFLKRYAGLRDGTVGRILRRL